MSFALEVFLRGVTQLGIVSVIEQGCLRPGRRILGGFAAPVEDLADGTGMVTVVLEVLWQGDCFRPGFPEMRIEIPDLDGVRSQSRQQGKSRRTAHRLLAVGPAEQCAALGQEIHVWRDRGLVAITSEGGAQIIDGDEQDIERFCTGGYGTNDQDAKGM